MTTAVEDSKEQGGRSPGLPGYVECHFCKVRRKRKALRCVLCEGRLSLRERLVREAETKIRRKVAFVLSLLCPGLGHAYRSSPGTGFFFFFIIGTAIGYLTLVEGEMTSGRWSTIAVIVLLYFTAAIDAARGQSRQAPPCQEACPAGLACALYVGLIREGKSRESLEMVKSLCPFPGSIGRVCHHPCEQNCRRGEEGEPIAICALKRYLADSEDPEWQDFYRNEALPKDKFFKEKIAVVGGGPSGLSAALYLHILGFPVTLFESSTRAGGMPMAAIPDYRLPAHIYNGEVQSILSLGFEVRMGTSLGKDFTLKDLKEEGFSAAYIALGAQRGVRLPHCGSREEGFLEGLEFLREAKLGKAEALKGKVLVIGGGNVAVDVAKTAVRLGADEVRKIFLETRETMPAHRWECEEALEEGVMLLPASATISFEMKNGRVVSALCKKVERIDVDDKGRMKPVLWEGTDFTVEADTVIMAVGTGPDYSVIDGPPERKPLRKGVRVGRLPSVDGLPVLIGGDYFAGPASVIDAVAAGYGAAVEIYRILHKFSFFRLPVWNRIKPILYPGYTDSPEREKRIDPAKVAPEDRCDSFCEVCSVYGVSAAEEEAARCLRCRWPMEPVKLRRRPKVKPLPGSGNGGTSAAETSTETVPGSSYSRK